MVRLKNQPKLRTNLDTDFLKLIAVLSMTVDHVGAVFFPEYPVFRWIGRMAFPLFCYCMTVGLLYTHDIRRYLARLGVFALLSQPFWILAFNADDFLGNLLNFNIFFTLFVSLLAMWGFKEHNWPLFLGCVLLLAFVNFDYSVTGVMLMLIFYLCRQKPALGALLYTLSYLPALWGGSPEDPLACHLGPLWISFEFFALLALPLIFFRTPYRPAHSQMVLLWLLSCHLLAISWCAPCSIYKKNGCPLPLREDSRFLMRFSIVQPSTSGPGNGTGLPR